MPISQVQAKLGPDGTSTAGSNFTLAFTNPVSNNSYVTGFFTSAVSNGTGGINYTVTDDKANAYTIQCFAFDGAGGAGIYLFSSNSPLTNSPQTISASSHVANTFNFCRLGIEEWSGLASTSAIDGTPAATVQSVLASGTDAIKSSSTTTAVTGDLVWGATLNTNGGVQSATTGTNYTNDLKGGATDNLPTTTEYRILNSASAVQATFTTAFNNGNWTTGVLALKATTASAANPFFQTDWPVTREFREYREWSWKYNQNLIGKDVLPFRTNTPRHIAFEEFRDYREWSWKYNQNLIGKDLMISFSGRFTNEVPRDIRDYRSWEWKYNQNLIGQDKLPNRQQDWPVPPEFRLYREWFNRLTPGALLAPFKQTDWPLSPDPRLYKEYQTWYTLSLIGKDKLPVRQQEWPNPREFREYREWSEQGNNFPPIPAGNPFFQLDWPLFREFREYRDWTWWYNQNLIGKDKLPNRQQDWPLTPDIRAYREWYLNLVLTTLFVTAPTPRNQYDWPLSPDPRQYREYQAWYDLNLIGKDQLPVRQQDWPLPYPVVWYQDWKKEYDRYLLPGQDKLPFRQLDWENPILVQFPLTNNIDPLNLQLYPSSPAVVYILMPQICL